MRYQRNIIGLQFGMLTVVERCPEPHISKGGKTDFLFLCRCECGGKKAVRRSCLTYGSTRSCGCNTLSQRNDLTGKRFGFLTVVKRSDIPITYRDGQKRSRWICRCDCGNLHEATRTDLVKGRVRSCGCFRSRQRTILGE